MTESPFLCGNPFQTGTVGDRNATTVLVDQPGARELGHPATDESPARGGFHRQRIVRGANLAARIRQPQQHPRQPRPEPGQRQILDQPLVFAETVGNGGKHHVAERSVALQPGAEAVGRHKFAIQIGFSNPSAE